MDHATRDAEGKDYSAGYYAFGSALEAWLHRLCKLVKGLLLKAHPQCNDKSDTSELFQLNMRDKHVVHVLSFHSNLKNFPPK